MRSLLFLMLGLAALAGCAQNVRQVSIGDLEHFKIMPVYYVTDRKDTHDANLNKRFDAERAQVSYGISSIAIPSSYPKAQVPSFLHWNLSLKRDPYKNLALLAMDNYSEQLFFRQLNQTGANRALIFIHGFNTPFERANRISAKLNYDLDFNGPIILFSWPSLATTTRYAADEANLAWSEPDFEHLLINLFEQTDLQVNLMAHSLGNRALTNTLIRLLDDHPEWIQRINAVILAAPDIDAGNFERFIGPELTQYGLPMTLYTSSNDLALRLSRRIHKNPRAGEAGDFIIVLPGMDTIDASLAEAELLGHEYYYQGPHAVADLHQWLVQDIHVEQRKYLKKIPLNDGYYWQLQPFDYPVKTPD
jgi:esterase/lipase superfamily enzyme